jgi:hypothetical protein
MRSLLCRGRGVAGEGERPSVRRRVGEDVSRRGYGEGVRSVSVVFARLGFRIVDDNGEWRLVLVKQA